LASRADSLKGRRDDVSSVASAGCSGPRTPGTRRIMTFRQSAEKVPAAWTAGRRAGNGSPGPLRSGRGHRPRPGGQTRCISGSARNGTPFPRIGKFSRPAGGGDACSAPFGRCWRLLFVPLAVGDAASPCREPVCGRTWFHRLRSGVSCGLFRCLRPGRRGCPGAQRHPGESGGHGAGHAERQVLLSGCPGSGAPAGAAGGRAAAGGAGARPDGILPGFHAGHDRDAQGADATTHPSQAGTGFAGCRDDLICGPRSVPPRVLPFRRWRMISRHVPGAAATPRALCAAGAWLATRAARRCIPASLLQAGPAWPLPPLAGSAGQAAGGRRKDCRRCTGLPQAMSVSRPGNTVLHRRAFARRTGSSRPSAS